MEAEPFLRQIGLTEREITVYLSCLELGESNASAVVRKVGPPRSTVVYTLEQLAEKGFLHIVEKGHRRAYIPVPPRTWASLLRARKNELDEQLSELETALPQLSDLYGYNPFQPHVRFFRGRLEIREIYEDILAAPINEMWYVGSYRSILEIIGEQYLKEWIRQRIKKQMVAKSIRTSDDRAISDPIFLGSKMTGRQVRYAPNDFKNPGHLIIYGDHVAIITTAKENFGVVITSREYAAMMRDWFRQLWKVSE